MGNWPGGGGTCGREDGGRHDRPQRALAQRRRPKHESLGSFLRAIRLTSTDAGRNVTLLLTRDYGLKLTDRATDLLLFEDADLDVIRGMLNVVQLQLFNSKLRGFARNAHAAPLGSEGPNLTCVRPRGCPTVCAARLRRCPSLDVRRHQLITRGSVVRGMGLCAGTTSSSR